MSFIEVATISQVPLSTMKYFSAGDKQILITNYLGKYYTMDAKCPHAGGSLSKGKLDGKILTCPNHGAKFDVTTGSCVVGPQIGFIKLKARNTQVYETKVDADSIKVNI